MMRFTKMNTDRLINELLGDGPALLSLEFFPPKTEEAGARIVAGAQQLAAEVRPDFVSITYGAGGSTRERTRQYAGILREECGFRVMPHLTCVGSTQAEILRIVEDYFSGGFRNIMALRGDPPKGSEAFVAVPDGLAHASDLVALIRTHFPEMCLGVAGYPEKHPEAPDLASDLQHLRQKVEAGGSFITTQLFFDNAIYFKFLQSCRAAGILCPVLPGIMPALSLAQVERFCAFCGARLPEELRSALAAADGIAEAEEEVGIDWACRQISELLQKGVPGIHLYILNRPGPAIELCARLRRLGVLRGA